MLIEFRYKVSNDTLKSLYSTFGGNINQYMFGYMDPSDAPDLAHCSLYIVCNTRQDENDNIVLQSPVILAVAKNNTHAVNIYSEATSAIGDTLPTVFGALEMSCKNLVVEPTGRQI